MSEDVALVLIPTFGGIVTTLLGFIAKQLYSLAKDVHELKLDSAAFKAHLGVEVKQGVAIKLKRTNGAASDYAEQK